MAYRVYVTDALRLIAENTARFANGQVLNMRYLDMIQPNFEKIEDKKSAEKIVDDIVARAGITVVRNQ